METRSEGLESLLIAEGIIDVGEVHVSRTGLGKNKQGHRYLIYLPISRNYLWEKLYSEGKKVRVFIEIVK